ncbi:hypothetical protein COOONC_25753 [Cooperia oncophora]
MVKREAGRVHRVIVEWSTNTLQIVQMVRKVFRMKLLKTTQEITSGSCSELEQWESDVSSSGHGDQRLPSNRAVTFEYRTGLQEQENTNGNHADNGGDISMDSERIRRSGKASQETSPRKQMAGVSIITCLVCDWTPSMIHDANRMRDEVSSHVRLHIREESNKLPNRGDSFFGDKRLLSCMDFSLEEYFEKEHLTDLSGTINSRIMERVYGDLLAKRKTEEGSVC